MQLEAVANPVCLRAGEGSNGGRAQMLPAGTAADGATAATRHGRAAHFLRLATVLGALALKLAVQALEGATCPRHAAAAAGHQRHHQACQEGSWAEMKAGCNAFAVRGAEPGLVRVDLFGRHAGVG